jgi:hypothetical protein
VDRVDLPSANDLLFAVHVPEIRRPAPGNAVDGRMNRTSKYRIL